jgi:hypothetical protein
LRDGFILIDGFPRTGWLTCSAVNAFGWVDQELILRNVGFIPPCTNECSQPDRRQHKPCPNLSMHKGPITQVMVLSLFSASGAVSFPVLLLKRPILRWQGYGWGAELAALWICDDVPSPTQLKGATRSLQN